MNIKYPVSVFLLVASLGLAGCPAIVAGGIAGAALVVTDRRSTGVYLSDQNIELNAQGQIKTELTGTHVNVTSFNRVVVMTGEVPSVDTQRKAELIVRGQPKARKVFNHTVVGKPSSFMARSKDTAITTAVRTRLLDAKGVHPNHVKVVTERGVVYLLGLLTPKEAEATAKVVSETAGVQKVITAFEYIKPN